MTGTTTVQTEKQIKFLQALIQCHQLEMTPDYEGMTRSKASKLIDGIILEHGNLRR